MNAVLHEQEGALSQAEAPVDERIYTKEQREEGRLYFALHCAADLRGDMERLSPRVESFAWKKIERDGWLEDARHRLINLRMHAWQPDVHIARLMESEGLL